jgi:hypothetical protein
MTTPQIFAEECKQPQRKYMQWAKADRAHRELRESAVKLALMVRKHARQWRAYE